MVARDRNHSSPTKAPASFQTRTKAFASFGILSYFCLQGVLGTLLGALGRSWGHIELIKVLRGLILEQF